MLRLDRRLFASSAERHLILIYIKSLTSVGCLFVRSLMCSELSGGDRALPDCKSDL